MKKTIISICTAIALGTAVSCTDNFEDININPNKIYEANMESIFPGSVYKTINAMAELNYNQMCWWARYSGHFGGSVDMNESTSDSFYKKFYVEIIRDLELSERQYDGVPGYENRVAIVRTWKAYIYSIVVSMYGGMPLSDAMIFDPNKFLVKHDTEEEMYRQILDMLKKASESFNPDASTTDVLKKDPVFRGTSGTTSDIIKWRKFANTLRLEVAMRATNIAPDLAEQHARECMEHEDWIIASLDDMVAPAWGSDVSNDVSYYYNRFLKKIPTEGFREGDYPRINEYFFIYLRSYNDPRLEAFVDPTETLNQYTVNDTITRPNPYEPGFRDSIAVTYRIPHLPSPERSGILPRGWEVAIDPNSPNGTTKYESPYTGILATQWSLINYDFIKPDAKHIIMNWADACFLKAEAALRYGIGSKSAEGYYYEGIEASFAQYGLTSAVKEYKEQNGIKWNTNGKGLTDFRCLYHADINGEGDFDNHLEQIIKQRYIADYFNGYSAWCLERRTRVLKFPPFFCNSTTEGSNGTYDFIPERYVYPLSEITNNTAAYWNAVSDLLAQSPYPINNIRKGDNLQTHLKMSLVNPLLENADANYMNRTIAYSSRHLQKWYGNTEEEFIKNVQKIYPDVTSSKLLRKYIGYKATVISTYEPK
ncbi:SusD/RagB family nutrient-binding outer membrane lipoprotein [Coprobacter fastidiosus]|jgi:hypothetical protein|uniref:SusD/RagB family nutrient-binding outer membrane lipoprotein n=1 Tax=Coprobacter fastidiosus TaxID=1099853 RepID=UPI00241E9799|nr:SusD/RagB family nutrient-binding outer membrane lipoprotein [Coprobacter fastidiosus]